ncbi:MAG: 4Fe-4S dicluster domain-containing protein [Coriobacteriales bacterium]|jgi:succinate dehydrogenase/fumarate reductase iron-sulfur protein|nr:4Fe-4S dicluster domain-containing protein [Coriobacteriales bacterium]
MNITIVRFDPTTDKEPYESTYDVPYFERMTALEAVMYIYENYEPIAFDYSCHGRSCGRCGMTVDGEPKLTCIAPISDGSHTIAPLKGYPVIRDLIVDQSGVQKLTSRLYNRVQTHILSKDEINTFDMENYEKIFQISWCTRCGRCTADCPAVAANPEYVGPMSMLATAYRYYDINDQADRVVEALNNGLTNCIQCGNCTMVCTSKEIDHVTYWKQLLAEARERGLYSNI